MAFRWEMLKNVKDELPAESGSNYLWFMQKTLVPVCWNGSYFYFEHDPLFALPVKLWRFKREPD